MITISTISAMKTSKLNKDRDSWRTGAEEVMVWNDKSKAGIAGVADR
jgi:hypothetical protein